MKNRIAASLALAAALTLGMSGCSLIAHNGTSVEYAPSDGVQVTSDGVALRNIILVADESGENFNLVFTAVNTSGAPAQVVLNMESEGTDAVVAFEAPVGTTSFGSVENDEKVLVTALPGLQAGQTVKTYFTINGAGDLVEFIPLLDGTLAEYADYVLDLSSLEQQAADVIDLSAMTEAEIAAAAKAAGESVEEFTKRVTEAVGSDAKVG